MIIKSLIKCFCITGAIIVLAMPVFANDPLSVKLDNMKNGITRLIGAVEEQRARLEVLQRDFEDSKSNEDIMNEIIRADEELEKLRITVKDQITEIMENAATMNSEISLLSSENEKLRLEHAKFSERLTQIEAIFQQEKQIEQIVKRADGSAEVFKISAIAQYREMLPSSEDCVEYGRILQNFPDRDLNSLFVINAGDVIQLCKLEYGLSEWQVQLATIADRAHIITRY